MNKKWYIVKGDGLYRNGCFLTRAKIWVEASSVEEACQKARKFLEPCTVFEPRKCKWKRDIDEND